jgi:putative hydrolase of the HAD superfamily
MIQAVTFDFWDTIAIDDSDELKRKARSLPTKKSVKERLILDAFKKQGLKQKESEILDALNSSNKWFDVQWKKHARTPKVAERIQKVCEFANASFGHWAITVIEGIEGLEVEVMPDLAPGIEQALVNLKKNGIVLGVISDAIHTPGIGVRKILQSFGLLDYFKVFVFSDEVGASKPSPVVFNKAISDLGVDAQNAAHVGDRESNDVLGPKAVKMKSILYTGIKDRREGQPTQANAVCSKHHELPKLVESLS